MEKNVLVTVITVCYNSEKTIARTIESILQQTYDNIEYIIIDGASTDDTLTIIDSYQEPYRARYGQSIHLVSEPDKGIYDAMNKGISMACGEMIGILNSDDAYEHDAIENIVLNMCKEKMQICYGAIRIFEGATIESICLLSHEFLDRRMIAHPGCFVSKSIYEKYGVFNIRYKSSADYEFMLRIYMKEDIKFIRIEKILTNYYIGGISTTVAGLKDKAKMLYDNHRISLMQYIYRITLLKVQNFFSK